MKAAIGTDCKGYTTIGNAAVGTGDYLDIAGLHVSKK